MEIRRYSPEDEDALLAMLRDEGGEWECYYDERHIERFRAALDSSISYLAFENEALCGYARCRDDDGLGLYVYDLLVPRPYRGKGRGRELMMYICASHHGEKVYVMSDADGYYEKLGCRRAGSVFIVCER